MSKSDQTTHHDPNRIINAKEVAAIMNRSVSFIYYKVQKGSPYYDNTFPVQIRLGDRATGWKYGDIIDWIESRRNMGAPS